MGYFKRRTPQNFRGGWQYLRKQYDRRSQNFVGRNLFDVSLREQSDKRGVIRCPRKGQQALPASNDTFTSSLLKVKAG